MLLMVQETASTWDKNKRWTKEAPPAPADMPVDPADVIPAAGLVLSGEAQVRIAAIEEQLDKAKRDLWKLCRDVCAEAPALMADYDPSAKRGAAYVYDDSKTAEQNAELEKAHTERYAHAGTRPKGHGRYPGSETDWQPFVYDPSKTAEQNAEAKAEWRRGQNRDAQGGYGREGTVAKGPDYEGRPGYANPNQPAKYP